MTRENVSSLTLDEVTKRVVTSSDRARLDAQLGLEQVVDRLRVRLAAG